ncbi:ABC1-domain-containing protein, partial [Rhodotorula sp. JG-1b]
QRRLLLLALALAAFATAYEFSTPFRHGVIAVERCAVIGWAVLRAVVDYKLLFRKEWPETAEGHAQRHQDYEDTHWKAAHRLMEALRQLGGIYIKLGQHLSTVQLIPAPWAEAMRPLQDQCFPTPLEELQALFLAETGAPMTYFFSSFDPDPIGVASLAQVHKAVERESGRMVAVKCMHPHLEEFAAIDMQTTTFLLHAVKRIFPTFEFTWLGEEMEQNLPLEMDFRAWHEAANAARCVRDFADLKQTTLVLPEVMWAKKRVMVMEFIQGGRVDDLAYLAKHKIDRNLVSREIAEITARMIHITGFFHADLHGGNLLIRPALPHSRSPYNFEVVLLDHGLYFDLPDDLRVNYSKFWLSLMESNSPSVEAARRKYAKLVANIDDDHYPLFQAAITGRAALQGATLSGEETKGTTRRGSMLDLEGNTPEERKMMRRAMVEGGPDGSNLLEQLFVILRNIPRRMLMIFKVNDLNRALDISLQTTHSPVRIFLIIASYCNLAIRLDDLSHLPDLTLRERFSSWWRYQSWRLTLWMYTFGAESKTVLDRWKGIRRKELVLEL